MGGRARSHCGAGETGRSVNLILLLLFLFLILLFGFALSKDTASVVFKVRYDARSEACACEVGGGAMGVRDTGPETGCGFRTQGESGHFSFWVPRAQGLRLRGRAVFREGEEEEPSPGTPPRFFLNGEGIGAQACEYRGRRLRCSFSLPGGALKRGEANRLTIVTPSSGALLPAVDVLEVRSYRASSSRFGIWCVLTERRLPDDIFLPLSRHPIQALAVALLVWAAPLLVRRASSKRPQGLLDPSKAALLALSPASLFSMAVILAGAVLRIRIIMSSLLFFELILLPAALYTAFICVRDRAGRPRTLAAVFPTEHAGPTRASRPHTVAVMGVFLLLTILMTYPLALRIDTHVCGDSGDKHQFIWNFWWFHKALVELKTNPFFTPYLYHPHGTSLLLSATTPFNTLLSVPLQEVLSRTTVYNLFVLFSFWAAAVGMYCLVFHLTRSAAASLVSGFIFSFSAYHFAHALGHLNLLSIEWIPFFLLYTIKSFQEPRVGNVLKASAMLVLNALCCWYYLVFCALFLGFAALYFLVPWDRNQGTLVLRKALQILCLSAVVLSPLVAPMILEEQRGRYRGGHDPTGLPADLASFLVPNLTLTYSCLFYPAWSRFRADPSEGSNYVGLSVLLLLVYSLRKVPRPLRSFWLFMAALFFLLSLGPFLNILGFSLPVPLPYLLYHHVVPFSRITGVPARFHIITMACISVLAGYGLKALLEGSPRNRHASLGTRLRYSSRLLPLAIWILIDHLHIPVICTKTSVSPFYRSLGREPGTYAIVDRTDPPKALFFQTVHQKHLVGGYVSRVSSDNARFLEGDVILKAVMGAAPSSVRDAGDRSLAQSEFERLEIKYLVYPKDQGRRIRFVEELTAALRLPAELSMELEQALRGGAAGTEAGGKSGRELLRRILVSSSYPGILKSAFAMRWFLADHAEVTAGDRASIERSESLVRDVWGFPCVYEDETIRVYSPVLDEKQGQARYRDDSSPSPRTASP